MINLKDLEQAFAPLSEIGHKEKEFNLFGMEITLTTLSPLQESSVQRAVAESQEDQDAAFQTIIWISWRRLSSAKRH